MGSTRQQDRSLGGGISLPQWMKGKFDSRFDFDESTFSPPSHDDNFFYLRYPKAQANQSSDTQGYRPIDQVITENKISSSKSQTQTENRDVPQTKEQREIDFSKHPIACQPFVPSVGNKGNQEARPVKTVIAGNVKAKSQGTDDGFHGEPALCGKSIVHVANQMISGKFNKVITEQMEGRPKKGSKSLPATPVTTPTATPDSSPKARRKLPPSRYFAGSYGADRDKFQTGWILSSLLGQTKELVTPKIDEEDESLVDAPPPPKTFNRKKSISSQNLTYIGKEEKNENASKSTYTGVFQAKPTELREMNFWSPTSM